MITVKKFDLLGNHLEPIVVEGGLLSHDVNLQMVKDYIVALRANFRQRGAHTKTRAEVNHSGQKPHPQKGTGRARQGYLGSTQYKGGGRPKGPRAQIDHHVRINRKERRAAIRYLFAKKIESDQLFVLDKGVMEAPKTRVVASFLKNRGLFSKKVLFLASPISGIDFFVKSVRNVPNAKFMFIDKVSGYDIMAYRNIVVIDFAVQNLMKILEC